MKRILPFLLLLAGIPAAAQPSSANLTLQEVIERALGQSAIAKQAQTTREKSYWDWRNYQTNYKPQLGLRGTLPGIRKDMAFVEQADGTTKFEAVRSNSSHVAMTLSQNIGPTGGQVYVASELKRVYHFNGDLKAYNNQPLSIGFTQPLGMFNNLRWARQIEPLRYQESQRIYVEERESIAQRITELYFDVLQQQVNAEVASQNVQANEEMLRIGKERYHLGLLSQSDLLRLELNLLNARQAMAQGRLDAQNAAVSLQIYTGLRAENLRLAVPAAAPRLVVPEERALEQARQNRSTVLAFRRRLLQAERDVALARGTTGFQASLSAGLGYGNEATNLWNTYNALQNRQEVLLTFSMPLVDWGRQKSIVKSAELTRRQVQADVAQEEASFDQSVQVQAAQLSTLSEQLDLAGRADSLAQQRYNIAQATYKVGRISLTDLTIASNEKDQARRAYILALRAAWVAHYRLRALTLYDFERQLPLTAQ
ncbi:Outer membrane protein TolC [Hymenobacter gelipurpurascens]|uniref:Outer membrane protein TolC n=1 Tax=Hymenobacter gelipurpurascens TaxID=89968 RepID=A0A212TG46_9BACT|nr:TolC family protein [Hymenobacter gelipurpurascens]SNC65038.1 Outer membrane protein TolC [Hymenobacter gelipurpurascens]